MGLSEHEVIESRKKYGSNIITKKKKETFFQKYLESLGDPIIKILLIALGIKVVFLIKDFDWYETIGIVISIFIASFISTISEYGSEKAFDKLQDLNSKLKSRVIRNNKVEKISIDDIVKNDVLLLSTGDRISADGILIEGSLNVDESSINGETIEAEKKINSNVYRGTVVYDGEAKVKVTEVGDNTFYGHIAKELQSSIEASPLKNRLIKLAKIISYIGYVSSLLVAISYLFSVIVIRNNYDIVLIKDTITNFPLMFKYILYSLTLCVTIIVVCVPEGLPMMITLVLSSNMKKMLKNNVLVRKLVGIETAGNINILFTDKTGTLTKGELEVVEIMNGELHSYKNKNDLKKDSHYYNLIKVSFVCNNSGIYNNEVIGGNSTDKSLLKFIKEKNDINIVNKESFNSDKKYSSCEIKYNNEIVKLKKGAPEILLKQCLYYFDRFGNKKIIKSLSNINKMIELKNDMGYRVIVCTLNNILVSIVFIKDDIKDETKQGITNISRAHIDTIMITGDSKNTAYAIAKECNIIKSKNDLVLTSSDINRMSDEELSNKIKNIKVIARALPNDKLRLIKVCQQNNLVVGMTGDGVNDAPALKRANVGFSMGSGTEVAKEASDIIILDDNLLSISKAVLYGRTIFKSIRKFIIFQLTVNMCAVVLSVVGPFIGFETPVTVIQMLWVNMVMDTLAGLAFSFEPALDEYLDEYPKEKNESIMNSYMFGEIIFTGFYSSIICIYFLKSNYIYNFFRSYNYFITGFFGLFIFMSIANSFNARTSRINILANLLKNKIFIIVILFVIIIQLLLIYYGGKLFRTSGLNLNELLTIIIMSISVIPVDWIRKYCLKLLNKKGGV